MHYLFISGSSDAGTCPSIASLRPGSVAYNSDQLMPGDRIHNINGINTSRLRPDDVITLLSNVEERALIDVEYSIPDCGKSSPNKPKSIPKFQRSNFFQCRITKFTMYNIKSNKHCGGTRRRLIRNNLTWWRAWRSPINTGFSYYTCETPWPSTQVIIF